MLYHLTHSLQGTPVEVITDFIIKAPVPALSATLLLYSIPFLLSYFSRFRRFKKIGSFLQKYFLFFAYLISVVFFIIPLHRLNIIDWVSRHAMHTNLYENHYVDPHRLTIEGTNRNIIVIFAESLETAYLDKKLFKRILLPRLSKISRDKGLYFGNYSSLPGTDWTIAAQVSFFCGIPLAGNYLDLKNDKDPLLQNALCWPEILRDRGYNTYYLQGSSIYFSGVLPFFSNHGFTTVIGKESLVKNNAFKQKTPWGVADKDILDRAKTVLTDLARKDEPFLMTLATVDTHSPGFYVNEGCTIEKSFLQSAVTCTDTLLSDFILWVEKQPFFQNTTLIITGDHLMPQDYFRYKNRPRHIFNFILNNMQTDEPNRQTAFTMLDFAPTVLEAAGFTWKERAYGLGVSLFSKKTPLIARPEISLAAEITKQSDFYDTFNTQNEKNSADIYLPYDRSRPFQAYIKTILLPYHNTFWTRTNISSFQMNFPSKRPLTLSITAKVILSAKESSRTINIFANGKKIKDLHITQKTPQPVFINATIPAQLIQSNGNLDISITMPLTTASKDDFPDIPFSFTKKLGVGFIDLFLEQKDETHD